MDKLNGEAHRLNFLADSFLDEDEIWMLIDRDNAADIIKILERDRQLALYGVDLDQELADRREKARREHLFRGEPIRQLNRLLEKVAREHAFKDRDISEDWHKELREIEDILTAARRAEDVTELVAAFFEGRGKKNTDAYRALGELFPGDPKVRADTLRNRKRTSKKKSMDNSQKIVRRRRKTSA